MCVCIIYIYICIHIICPRVRRKKIKGEKKIERQRTYRERGGREEATLGRRRRKKKGGEREVSRIVFTCGITKCVPIS